MFRRAYEDELAPGPPTILSLKLALLVFLYYRAENLVDRPLIERDDKEISVWTRLNVRDDSEVSSYQQAFAFSHIVKGQVICDAICEPGITYINPSSVPTQIKAEQWSTERLRERESHKQVAMVLIPQAPAIQKTECRRCQHMFPAESGSL